MKNVKMLRSLTPRERTSCECEHLHHENPKTGDYKHSPGECRLTATELVNVHNIVTNLCRPCLQFTLNQEHNRPNLYLYDTDQKLQALELFVLAMQNLNERFASNDDLLPDGYPENWHNFDDMTTEAAVWLGTIREGIKE